MAYFKTQEAYFNEESNEICIKTFEPTPNGLLNSRKRIARNIIEIYQGVDVVSFYERGYSLDATTFAHLPEPSSNEVIYLMSYARGKWTEPHAEKFGCDVHLKEYCAR